MWQNFFERALVQNQETLLAMVSPLCPPLIKGGIGGIYQVSRLTKSPHPPCAKGGSHGAHGMPKEVS